MSHAPPGNLGLGSIKPPMFARGVPEKKRKTGRSRLKMGRDNRTNQRGGEGLTKLTTVSRDLNALKIEGLEGGTKLAVTLNTHAEKIDDKRGAQGATLSLWGRRLVRRDGVLKKESRK